MTKARDIRAAVYEELDVDPLIDPVDIVVEVLDSSVLLNGTVPSQAQRSEATAAAWRVNGVTQVENQLDVALPAADYGDDETLMRLANEALAANTAVPDGVTATARAGCVYLVGTVSESAQRVACEDTVADLGGVLSISNEIDVLGDA